MLDVNKDNTEICISCCDKNKSANNEEEIEVKIIERLSLIARELYARETGGNCVVQELLGKGWVELCDEGIHLFEKLK